MITSPPTQPWRVDDAGAGQRLNGWKEIAAYLGRGERTVKRWEAQRELPVRRVPGGGRAAVHAYQRELETWLRSSRAQNLNEADPVPFPSLAIEPAPEEHSPHTAHSAHIPEPSRSSTIVANRWGTALFALVCIAAAVWFPLRQLGSRRNPAPPPTNRVSPAERALAQQLYLKGRFEWSRRTPESLNRALDDFTQAIFHDPLNAPTYAGMADTYMLLHEYSLMPEHEAYTRARAAAVKAVQLDDSLAEAHRSLAFVYAWGNWDFVSAEKEIRRAIQLDPRDPIAHLWYATMFGFPEWRAVAGREFDRAQELDPSSSIILANKSIWLFNTGSTQAGLDLARRLEHDNPGFVAAHRYLAMMTWHLRDYPSFLDESEQMATLKHDAVLHEIVRQARLGYARSGKAGLLRSLYASQRWFYSNGQLSGEVLALTCARLGRNDEAITLLQDDFAHRRADFLQMFVVPDLLSLKSDPQFRQLASRLPVPSPPNLKTL